ncbi:MAG: D-aminoacylase [Calditrichaeota bacterium]|nr:MAG: D-aminoacylase [Calditrichota bacterium]
MDRRSFIKKSAVVSFAATLPTAIACNRHYDFDIIIQNGLLYDGFSANPVNADLGVKDGKITAIGMLKNKSARRQIDAKNRVVCPGFIDIHGHSDDDLLVDGRALSKIHQGVTTEVVGQDGGSMAPLNNAMIEAREKYYKERYGLEAMWSDFSGYFSVLKQRGISMNLASMVGAGTLRENVIGMADRPATADELSQMQHLFAEALQQGARHISTGLEYTPGSFASEDELAQLVSVMQPNGIYATHMRNEDDRVVEAIREAIAIAEKGGVRLHISHLKVQGERNWHKLEEIIHLLDATRNRGLHVTCDRYPYVAYSTGLTNLFPLWSREGGREEFIKRLQNQGLQTQIRSAVDEKIASLGSWNAVQISSLGKNTAFVGKRLGDLAEESGKPPFEFLLNLMIDEGGRGGMVGFGMSEENTAAILQYPFTVIASDGSALAEKGPLAEGNPHPRNFGTFARVLGHYTRDKNIINLSEAIRKMTALPADILGCEDRGRIKPGMWADIVVFDPDKVKDKATFAQPKQFSEGFKLVLVNGIPVLENDEHLGTKPGVIL